MYLLARRAKLANPPNKNFEKLFILTNQLTINAKSSNKTPSLA